MCIYCGTTKYRKIYENHFGPIPKDGEGRKYEIHHIDGNRSNNDLENLKCVSLQEHYDIHYSQGDWFASHKIAGKLKLTGEELSELARKAAMKRIEDGTHHFLDKAAAKARAEQQISTGTHNFLGDRNPVYSRVADGTHNFLGGAIQRKRAENGTHPFLGGEIQRKSNLNRVENGTHPSQTKITCEHCHKTIDSANYSRWHGNKCKNRTA